VERRSAQDETLRSGELPTRRITLRLGRPGYPFMKLMLQEHLVEGEFFFEVDTHDHMFCEDGEEAAEIRELKAANLCVKDSIEGALAAAGLPTARHIKGLVESWRRRRPQQPAHLLVDNEEDIAATLAMLLARRLCGRCATTAARPSSAPTPKPRAHGQRDAGPQWLRGVPVLKSSPRRRICPCSSGRLPASAS
jgi:hypothetical protein